jgi:CheY-like chemotaxis protein
VEDEYGLHEMIEDTLIDGGFEPAFAASGEEAVTLVRGRIADYRVLVTDIKLRGKLSGWEVARQARQTIPDLPIVYMTGAAAAEWPAQGVPKSILLQKPFAPAQLITAVAQLLNKQD